MSEKDPYAFDDPEHVDPSIAPEDEFPDSALTGSESLEKTVLQETSAEVPGVSLAPDVLQLAPDVPVSLVAVMGQKPVTIGDLLDFRVGDVVEFDRKPMDPVDLVVSGKVVAKAELVVVEGRLGLRVLKLFR